MMPEKLNMLSNVNLITDLSQKKLALNYGQQTDAARSGGKSQHNNGLKTDIDSQFMLLAATRVGEAYILRATFTRLLMLATREKACI